MLAKTDVRTVVVREINTLLLEDSDEMEKLTGDEELHELALNSLMLARLVIELEAAVGVDPFLQGDMTISDIRSVNDLIAAYQGALLSTAEAGT